MPTFVIVQCFACFLFLPQQQTKNNKFACRFCGEKQSIVKVFGRSENAKDLRGPAQQLNAQHGAERDRKLQSREVVAQEAPMQRQREEQGFRGRPIYAADDYNEDGYGYDSDFGTMDEEATEMAHRQQHQAAWMEEAVGAGAGAGAGGRGGGGSRWSVYMEEDDAAAAMQETEAAGGGEDDGRFVTELPSSMFNRGGGGRGRAKGRRERGGGRNGGRQQHGQGEEDGWGEGGCGGGSSMMEEDSSGWGAWGGQEQGGKGRRGQKRANNSGGHGYGQGEGGSAWGGHNQAHGSGHGHGGFGSNKRLHTGASGAAASSYPGAAPFQSTATNQQQKGGGAGGGNRWAAYL